MIINKDHMPLKSVIVPTSGERSSVFQLMKDFKRCGFFDRSDVEVCIIENGDRTTPFLKEVVETYGGIYSLQTRRGQAAALNRGIRRSHGEYLVLTDDDISVEDPAWLDRLANHFSENPKLGYVAGNILAREVITPAQKMWEAKGGLSKGPHPRLFDSTFFNRFYFHGVPLRFVAAGANCMIPRRVFEKVGLHDEIFGCGSAVGHSQSHEICYKIMRAGYQALYDPEAVIFHMHPESISALRKKMFHYGIGDTAVQFHFFLKYRDIRGLIEAFGARQFYLTKNLIKRLIYHYPLSVDMMLAGLLGNFLGPWIYLYALAQNKENWE